MAEIWGDPIKWIMLIIIILIAISLVYMWRKAVKERDNN
jgi:hypothetical protein